MIILIIKNKLKGHMNFKKLDFQVFHPKMQELNIAYNN